MDFLDEEFDQILNIFQVESEEIIARLNNSLLDLEKKPNNKDAILMLFRDAHSLKGASRLIGFNNVQTIAHKVEDILGLAKDNKLHFNSKIVDVLYKTIDFLADLIQKSIAKKQEIYSEDIPNQIAMLENITDYVDSQDETEAVVDFDINLLAEQIHTINPLIADCLLDLMKIEMNNDFSLINNLLVTVKKLLEIFRSVGHYELKQGFENLDVKLTFVSKVSKSLTAAEIEDIQQSFNALIITLISVCEIYGLEVVDYYSLAFEKLSNNFQTPSAAEIIPDAPDLAEVPEAAVSPEIVYEEPTESAKSVPKGDLGRIHDKFATLSQNYSQIKEISEFLAEFVSNCENESVKKVAEQILKIVQYSESNESQLDEDTVLALIQGIDYCNEILLNKNEGADNDLISQRLGIIQQLMELDDNEVYQESAEPQKSYLIKNKKIADFSTAFDSGEIKTLRVDSSKLDVLANQIGELMITKIKTKKHLQELNGISNELGEWQRNSTKVLGHLKYYDKKYLGHPDGQDGQMSFFIKQFLNVLNDNNKKFSETISNISNLSRTIQEDNLKTNLIVDDLEHMVKNIRVLPFATVFHIFGRMVRDIAQEKNKKIELEIIGSDTTTDKKIIEEIKSPLIHIIRNAISHGIETPEERLKLGKNPTGRISLRARALESKVIIEIEDDGSGINLEKIKAKALQKGYLTEEEINSMNNEQITNLIFLPGFSTGEEVTNISGRGIGLDVVQTKIAQLNGKVRIISEVNKGCLVQIELPTNMSTVKAFLVRASSQTFAVPMNFINTVVWIKSDDIFSSKDGKTIIFNDKNIPLYHLSDILSLPPKPLQVQQRATVLIIEGDNNIIGLAVDKLDGDQEILHKKLAAPLYKLRNISGVTTLASGEVCLILNIKNILKTLGANLVNKIPMQQDSLQLAERSMKVLIVDDSITTRTMEQNILSRANYKTQTVSNPEEAFENLKTQSFDLIITDVEMPVMDGFEFLEKLKSDEMYADIPVIMVSSLASEENKKRAKDLGAVDYIVKSQFEQDEFLNAIQAALLNE